MSTDVVYEKGESGAADSRPQRAPREELGRAKTRRGKSCFRPLPAAGEHRLGAERQPQCPSGLEAGCRSPTVTSRKTCRQCRSTANPCALKSAPMRPSSARRIARLCFVSQVFKRACAHGHVCNNTERLSKMEIIRCLRRYPPCEVFRALSPDLRGPQGLDGLHNHRHTHIRFQSPPEKKKRGPASGRAPFLARSLAERRQ